VLLDVTGHGIAAALTVNRIVGELDRTFSANAAGDPAPAELLLALNHYACLMLAQHGLYMTALCLRVDADQGIIQWTSGGHPTAFIRRGDGSIESLESTALIMGVQDEPQYTP